jgi:hypothetical protein
VRALTWIEGYAWFPVYIQWHDGTLEEVPPGEHFTYRYSAWDRSLGAPVYYW